MVRTHTNSLSLSLSLSLTLTHTHTHIFRLPASLKHIHTKRPSWTRAPIVTAGPYHSACESQSARWHSTLTSGSQPHCSLTTQPTHTFPLSLWYSQTLVQVGVCPREEQLWRDGGRKTGICSWARVAQNPCLYTAPSLHGGRSILHGFTLPLASGCRICNQLHPLTVCWCRTHEILPSGCACSSHITPPPLFASDSPCQACFVCTR